MFCGNCGNELREGARFCPKCGAITRLGRQQNQPSAEPEQAMPPVIPGPEPVLEPEPAQEPAGTNTPAEPAIEEDAAPAPRQQVRQRPAAGKAKPAVRLKAMPVKPAQEAQPAQQEKPARPVSPPSSPVDEEPAQQPAAPAQSSFLETGAARFASAVGSVKDALGGGSVQCGSCGTRLKAGTKFCPECGAAVTQPPNAEPVPAPDGQNSKGTVFNVSNQFDGTKARNLEGQAPQMGAAVETKPKAAPNKGRIIFFAVAGVFVVVIALLAALGSNSKTSYADGLVEANNEFGLSTTMTLEEFVERYNEALVSEGLDLWIYWIDFDDRQLLDAAPGITEYQLKFPDYKFPKSEMSKLQQHMNIGVDNETGYVVSVAFKYLASAYMAPSITDTETDVVGKRGFAVPIALFGSNAEEQLSRAAELMNSPQGYAWEKGILYIGAGDVGDGFVNVGFQTMTKEVYQEKYGQ